MTELLPTDTSSAQPSYLHGPLDITAEQRVELRDWRTFYRECGRRYSTELRPFGEDEYVALYVAQEGRCAICRKAKGRDPRTPLAYAGRKRKPRRLAVDHNHLTGLVRGLLCSGGDRTCNRIIGWLDLDGIERASRYLRMPPAVGVLRAFEEPEDVIAMPGDLFGDGMK
jgi:hypothetical protein